MNAKNGANGRHVVVVGAGPGGLTAAMLLAGRGFRVTVLEKEDRVGGRNASIRLGSYIFDTGPTFLMLKFILDEVFEEVGRRSSDYLEFTRLDPMYRLVFEDFAMNIHDDRAKMKAEIARFFPGEEAGLDRYYEKEMARFRKLYPCLQKPYSGPLSMLNRDLLGAAPRLSLSKTLYRVLGDYFSPEKLRLAFTFQAKYLGMSPWRCPAAFAMLGFVEHAYGVWHVKGGLSEISEAMARVAGELGAEVRLSSPVARVVVEDGKATGVVLGNGEKVDADEVVIGSDFGHSMTTLFAPGVLRKYTAKKLARKGLSCSTFMLYLGVNRTYDLAHHTIVFARSYRANTEDIFRNKRISSDTSFYVRNAGVSDPTLAARGKSALYVLVPVPNQTSGIDWGKEKERFRSMVLDRIRERLGLSGLEQSIEQELVITPADWEGKYGVYRGATFNLSHSLDQMLYFRPHNRFEDAENCWLAGGGTHPGSGLPTIYESGRISANMISEKYGVPFTIKTLKERRDIDERT